MDAKEAKERALSINEGVNKTQWDFCMKEIETAVSKGNFSVNVYTALTKSVISNLEVAGYTVTSHFDQRDGTTITIDWT